MSPPRSTQVLTQEPDWTRLPAGTPVPIRRLLRRCLEKDRSGSARFGGRVLGWRSTTRSRRRSQRRSQHAAAPSRRVTRDGNRRAGRRRGDRRVGRLGADAAGTGGSAPAVPLRDRDAARPTAQCVQAWIATSPFHRTDGTLVYRVGGTTTGGSPLMVRAIDRLDARPLAGVIDAYGPFVSPDSRGSASFERGRSRRCRSPGDRSSHSDR